MEALQMDRGRRAAARQEARDDLLFEHAAQLARDRLTLGRRLMVQRSHSLNVAQNNFLRRRYSLFASKYDFRFWHIPDDLFLALNVRFGCAP